MSFNYSDFKKFEMIKVLVHDEEEDIDEEQLGQSYGCVRYLFVCNVLL
jgi:hypothetical protein